MSTSKPEPADPFVVRGGRITGRQLHQGCAEHEGVYGFSVQSAPGQTVAALARAGEIPHGSLGVTTVSTLNAAGYDLVPTKGRGFHATVVVPRDWKEQDADELAAIFMVQPNPRRSR